MPIKKPAKLSKLDSDSADAPTVKSIIKKASKANEDIEHEISENGKKIKELNKKIDKKLKTLGITEDELIERKSKRVKKVSKKKKDDESSSESSSSESEDEKPKKKSSKKKGKGLDSDILEYLKDF